MEQTVAPEVIVPYQLLKTQLDGIFLAWGLAKDHAQEAAEVLALADLHGIDSHGIMLIPLYAEFLASGKVVPAAEIKVIRSLGATGVIDGGGGFGEAPSVRAMDLAVEKARTFGIGAVAVRNSNHYGAAGIYALRAAEKGFIGLSTTSVYKPSIVPTFGRAPRLGTNPIAFASPGHKNPPFLLDVATSTVAIGKLKLALREGRSLPEGWALDIEGRPQCDPGQALNDRLMTPLGGTREMGGHKGYGLAAMVEVLSTLLGGATYAPLRPADAARFDVGHFHMAIDPRWFREEDEFEQDLDAFVECLRATPPAAQDQPVLAPGDPENRCRLHRGSHGIPLPLSLLKMVERITHEIGAEFLLYEPRERES